MTPRLARRAGEIAAAGGFLGPFLVVLAVFVLWPLGRAVWLSFHEYDLFTEPRWVGLANYRRLLHDPDFWISLRNTTLYTAVVVTAQTVLAVALALVANQRLRGRAVLRTALFLPSVTSSVATSLIFLFLFFRNGLLNQLLAWSGLDSLLAVAGLRPPVDWLGDPRTSLWALMAMNVWSTAGFYMVIALAGLQQIPGSLYEAARVDGASPLQELWYVTLPSLRPTIFYIVTMGIIGCFQVFDQVYVMTEGGPLKSTLTTAYLLYREAFVGFDMGYACAIAVVLATVIFLATLVQRRAVGGEA